MRLSPTLSWLIDQASDSPGADRLLGELGARLVEDVLPLTGGALSLDVPHPLISRRTCLWLAGNGGVIEALGFAPGGPAAFESGPSDGAGRRWLASIAGGLAQEDKVGLRPGGPLLSWIGPRPFTAGQADTLREAARFAAAPLAALAARAALRAGLEAYLGRRSAARVLAGPFRRDVGEMIQAALLYADLRGFTELSENHPPREVISALGAWFDRIAGAAHAFGGEVLKFIGDGVLAIFPVAEEAPRGACEAALRAASAARAGMAHLDQEREGQGLPLLPFGVALHLGEVLWGNIGAADRLDFTAIGPAVNLVSRLEGLCRPLKETVLVSGALAAETETPLIPLGRLALRAQHRLGPRKVAWRIDVEERVDRRVRPLGDGRAMPAHENLHLAQTLLDERMAQRGGDLDRPQRGDKMRLAGRGRDDETAARGAAGFMQAGDEVGRREGRVGGERRRVKQFQASAIFEPGQNPGERPGEFLQIVGKHGQAEGGETLRIAVGADREGFALRGKALDGMGDQRLAAERRQTLVGASHPAGAAAIENDAEGRIPIHRADLAETRALPPQRLQHFQRGAPVRGHAVSALEIGDRLARLPADGAVGRAHVIAAFDEEGLQFAPFSAREARVVGRPGRHDARPPREAVGENAGGERIGFGGVIRIDDIEILRDKKGRTVRARRKQEPGVALANAPPVDARQTARRPERHGLFRLPPGRSRVAMRQLHLEPPRNAGAPPGFAKIVGGRGKRRIGRVDDVAPPVRSGDRKAQERGGHELRLSERAGP